VLTIVVLATFGGLFASAPPRAAFADELDDAYAKQQTLEELIAKQRTSIRSLSASQNVISSRISSTKRSLASINADLVGVKTEIVNMTVDVARSQSALEELATTAMGLDAYLAKIVEEETAKRAELESTKALLAARIREAYETDRTSILETMLSGEAFTDVVTQVGYHLDFAEEDKRLGERIVVEQRVLDVLHRNVELARAHTVEMRELAATSKTALENQLAELAEANRQLLRLEAKTERLLTEQRAAYAKLAADKRKLAESVAAAEKSRQALEALIDKLIQKQFADGRIPATYNGTFQWPMEGRITQEFGCTGFGLEPAFGSCAHFHRGIDIATTIYTPITAAGPGRVLIAGRSPYDSAWIVVIAHSANLVTWYGHVANGSKAPPVRVGEVVKKGQVIAYEGSTGNSTGPHLHWAVQLNGDWVDPRSFVTR
jgi:murein DD-endopeptidase MepM/ murein hydrolase activator NlpD